MAGGRSAGRPVLRRSIAHLLVALLFVSPGSIAPIPFEPDPEPPAGPGWPPEAWASGDIDQLSLHQIAMILAGLRPGHPDAQGLAGQLEILADMDPAYTDVADRTLRGLAEAYWHQEQAARDLSPQERARLLSMDADHEPTAEAAAMLGRIDFAHVRQALLALDQAAADVRDILQDPSQPSAARELASSLGLPNPPLPQPLARDASPTHLLGLVEGLSSIPVPPGDRAAAEAALAAAPAPARGALGALLEALAAVQRSDGSPESVVALGAAADQTRDVLSIWSAAAIATQLHDASTRPHLRLPDPAADRPDLRLALPALTDGRLPPAPPLADSLAELAAVLGDEETQAQSHALVEGAEAVLSPGQVQALSNVLHHTASYLAASEQAAEFPLPTDMDSAVLEQVAALLEEGALPEAASPLGQALLEALPSMEAQRDAMASREKLLLAVEELVIAFGEEAQDVLPPDLVGPMPMSHSPLPDEASGRCGQSAPGKIVLPPYFALDPCGRDTVWSEDELSILVLDAGGDDEYLGRFGGAPFAGDLGPQVGVTSLAVALVVDLGGSDHYNATGLDCAQGAACSDLQLGPDPTGLSRQAPLGVLVDWQGDGADVENRFEAGERSQGYGSNNDRFVGGVFQAPNHQTGYGMLLERVGDNSQVQSVFEAGDRSQGSTEPANVAGADSRGGIGILVRAVGDASIASATFTAGNFSQGAASPAASGVLQFPTAALMNVAGEDATSHDHYEAGEHAQGSRTQGSAAMALFADIAGSGSRSDDIYEAPNKARGFNGIFIDALLSSSTPSSDSLEEADPDRVSARLVGTGGRGSSNDTYSSLVAGHGNGTGAFFLDAWGDDVYEAGGSTEPRNNATWTQPPGGIGSAPTGVDSNATHDRDRDVFPVLLDPRDRDADATPLPTGAAVLLDLAGTDLVLDRAYALVLTTAGRDSYLSNFSAAVHLDLAGADEYLGPTAAAGPGLTQQALSFLLDLSGDDTYNSTRPGVQGYGAGTGTGILLDLAGSDVYRAPHAAQGVGAGGVGILVDLHNARPEAPVETNRFHAGDPAHGSGNGVFVATSPHHNEAPDGTSTDDGVRANLGANPAPRIVAEDVPPEVQAGDVVAFSAQVEDPHGDATRLCWRFQQGQPGDEPETRCEDLAGNGTATVQYAWQNVFVDGRVPERADNATYQVDLTVTDSGGNATASQHNVTVRAPTPRVAGELRGPRIVQMDAPVAYQLPFHSTADMSSPFTEAAWGDGTTDAGTNARRHDTYVDWASIAWGATIEVPGRVVSSPGGALEELDVQYKAPLDNAINSSTQDPTEFTYNPDKDAPIHVLVRLPDDRQVRQVEVRASLRGASSPVDLSVEGLLPSGALVPLGPPVQVDSPDPQTFRFDRTDHADLSGVLLRQIPDPAETSPSHLDVHRISALGPGATHAWTSPGVYDVNLTLVNEFEARNGTPPVTVTVLGDGASTSEPVQLVDIGRRGAVRHASLARDTEYTLEWGYNVNCNSNCVSVDWGDGSSTQSPSGTTAMHIWNAGGSHEVTLHYEDPNAGTSWQKHVTTVHVEEALELWSGTGSDPRSVPSSGGVPLLYLSLARDAAGLDGDTFYSPLRGADQSFFLGVVDALGDDRYVGTVAAPQAHIDLEDGGARPGFLLDLAGDDDYLSKATGSQGFGRWGAVGYLMDVLGDDRYVSAGQAQGAAVLRGAGALVDLGGNDAFNPMPAHDPDDPAAWHPDLVPLLPSDPDADTNPRPPSLEAPRTSLAGGPDLVQGAAREGLGILLTSGGYDTLAAGRDSQGHGSHLVETVYEYALPASPRDCFGTDKHPHEDPTPYILDGGGNPSPPEVTQVGCLLGVQNLRTDSAYYTGVDSNNPPSLWSSNQDDDRLFCRPVNFANAVPIPTSCPSGGPPNTGTLGQFLTAGERHGPGMGLMLRLDGASSLSGALGVQGTASASARGAVVDLDGAVVATADSQAQAYSTGGTSALVLGGPSVFRLGHTGQAIVGDEQGGDGLPEPEVGSMPEGVGIPLAIALGDPRDWECSSTCGDPNNPLDLRVDPTPAPSAPPTTLEWGNVAAKTPLTVHVEAGTDVELVLVTLSRDVGCTGPTLSPPTLVAHRLQAPEEGTVTFEEEVDFATVIPGDGPVHTAGCVEAHAFARQVTAGLGATEWSHVSRDVTALPPPVLESPWQELFSGGEPVLVSAFTGDPLGGLRDVDVEFRLVNKTGVVAQEFAPESGAWSGGSVDAIWDPGAEEVPDGEYEMQSRGTWEPSEDTVGVQGDWQTLVPKAVVDTDVPDVTVTSPTDGVAWRLGRPIPVAGTAQDASGVGCVEARLVDAQKGETMELRSSPGGTPLTSRRDCPGSLGAVPAPWQVVLDPDVGSFPGGPVRIETRARDPSLVWSGWTEQATVELDGDPPRVVGSLRNPETDTHATNAWDEVDVEITLRDGSGCTGACGPAAGVDASKTTLVVRLDSEAGTTLKPLPARVVGDDSSGTHLGFTWKVSADVSTEGLPLGSHTLYLVAMDGAGNLLVQNAGLDLIVDRQLPNLNGGRVVLPGGQEALKPGDSVGLSVGAFDAWPFKVWAVIDGMGKVELNQDTEDPLTFATTQVDLDDGVAGDEVRVHFLALDLAGNEATLDAFSLKDATGKEIASSRSSIPFHRALTATEVVVTERSDSVLIDWVTDHAVEVTAELVAPDGTTATGQVTSEAGGPGFLHRARFIDLQPDTPYLVGLLVRDAAGHVLDAADLGVPTLQTVPLPTGTALQLDPLPGTRSGTVTVTGEATQPLPSTLTLHLENAENPSITTPIDISQSDGLETFSFAWDTTELEASSEGAVEVTLVARMDADTVAWTDTIPIRIDNKRPTLDPFVEGPAPRCSGSAECWYNGTVVVHANATDDTTPLAYATSVDGADSVPEAAVILASDGNHQILFYVADGSTPPNDHSQAFAVHVDRTPPDLTVSTPLPDNATQHLDFPIEVEGDDATSLVADYRLRAGGDWNAWSPGAPTTVALEPGPDREQWVDVEVRDHAGNVQRRSVQVLLDRAPPEVLTTRWLGTSTGGEPVLHVVARDLLGGEGRAAGVAAIRFADAQDAWGAWRESHGNDAHAVPEALVGNGSVLVQVRDRAGNVANPVAVAAPPAEQAPVFLPAGPTRVLLQNGSVSPWRGEAGTPFAFSVLARPHGDSPPDEVWLELGGKRHAMEPTGPELAGGGILYAATVDVGPSSLQSPHQHRFLARYGDEQVATAMSAGPEVFALDAEVPDGVEGDDKDTPAPGLGFTLALLLLLATLTRPPRRNRP